MDEKDRKLLNLLQEDGRSSLKDLAKKINLSIDATKKRILKLKQQGVFTQFGIFVDPKQIGYDLVVDNKIKLTNITQEKRTKFISYLVEFHLCIELIAISGDYDFTCVLIAKDSNQLNDTIFSIREKFNDIISNWTTTFNLEVYKFEKYDFNKL